MRARSPAGATGTAPHTPRGGPPLLPSPSELRPYVAPGVWGHKYNSTHFQGFTEELLRQCIPGKAIPLLE